MSVVVLLIGYNHLTNFYKFPRKQEALMESSLLSVMTYNVRLFNVYDWNPDKQLDDKMIAFIKDKSPDILAIQEFHKLQERKLDFYPFRYIGYKTDKNKIGQAIFSKYPILATGQLDFPKTGNNGIYADILVAKDTVRVYNMHLESLHVNPEEEELSQENSMRLIERIGNRFALQQTQMELFRRHWEGTNYKTIVCGDLNNTAFSNIYLKIKGKKLQDTFQEAGSGFGRTFNFPYFPFRIDFILPDTSFEVKTHEVYPLDYSDHFPVFSSLSLKVDK